MKPKGLHSYRNIRNLKYKQLSTSRQMNQLAIEGKKTIDGGLLKRKFWLGRDLCFIIFLDFGCFGLFFFVLFVCCFVSSSPSSNKLSPRESYLINLLQTHNLQVPTQYFFIYPIHSKPQSIHKTPLSRSYPYYQLPLTISKSILKTISGLGLFNYSLSIPSLLFTHTYTP